MNELIFHIPEKTKEDLTVARCPGNGINCSGNRRGLGDGSKATQFRYSPPPAIGKSFGKNTVTAHTPDGKARFVFVQCICGSEPRKVQASDLKNGKLGGCKLCRGVQIKSAHTKKVARLLPPIGTIYGENTLVGYTPDKNMGYVIARCSCGSPDRLVQLQFLISGKTTGCAFCAPAMRGARKRKNSANREARLAQIAAARKNDGDRTVQFHQKLPYPIVGDSYGERTIISIVSKYCGAKTRVLLQCSCGSEPNTVNWSTVYTLQTLRCMHCAPKLAGAEKAKESRSIIFDDALRLRIQSRLHGAIARCHDPSDANYYNYGQRGISVYKPWRENTNEFLRYIVTIPGWDKPGLQMDRIDNNGNYAPKNLRFATPQENMLNRRRIPKLQETIDAQASELEKLRARIRQLERE